MKCAHTTLDDSSSCFFWLLTYCLLTMRIRCGAERGRGRSLFEVGPTTWPELVRWPELGTSVGARKVRGRPADRWAMAHLMLSSEGASPVALSEGDDTRHAWSCPPPNGIFTVGSQGRDEEIAGLGVAVALHRLLALGGTPARHASQPLDPVPLCLPSH